MFGPVSRQTRWPGERSQSFGTKAGPLARRSAASTTGWRPARMAKSGRSVSSGRHQLPSVASSALAARTSSSAMARAAAAMASPASRMIFRRWATTTRSRFAACSPASESRRSSAASAAQVKRWALAMLWRWMGARSPVAAAGAARKSFSPAAAGTSARKPSC